MDKRSESTVALTSYVPCSEDLEGGGNGGSIGPNGFTNVAAIDENDKTRHEKKNDNEINNSTNNNSNEILINVNSLRWNKDVEYDGGQSKCHFLFLFSNRF